MLQSDLAIAFEHSGDIRFKKYLKTSRRMGRANTTNNYKSSLHGLKNVPLNVFTAASLRRFVKHADHSPTSKTLCKELAQKIIDF